MGSLGLRWRGALCPCVKRRCVGLRAEALKGATTAGWLPNLPGPPDENHINALVGRFVYIVLDDSTVSIFQDLTIVI